jgi:hypothetical protein
MRMRLRKLAWTMLLGVILIISGCGQPPQDIPTISWTPMPLIETKTSSNVADMGGVPPTPSICMEEALFIEDLTIPDYSVVLPGATLDKRWSMQNSGSCDWGPGHQLVRLEEDQLAGPNELALYPGRAGATVVWQVVLTAPLEPGDYLSRWQARTPDGRLFGDIVYLLVVVALPTPTPTSTPLISPTP